VSDAGRKLSAVGASPGLAKGPAPAAPHPARHERAALAILGVLLAVCLVGLALSMGRNARQGREIAALSGELEDARAVLGAYESRLTEVREAVARLNALVEADPAPPAPPTDEPSS